jgi:hypothetical protein
MEVRQAKRLREDSCAGSDRCGVWTLGVVPQQPIKQFIVEVHEIAKKQIFKVVDELVLERAFNEIPHHGAALRQSLFCHAQSEADRGAG